MDKETKKETVGKVGLATKHLWFIGFNVGCTLLNIVVAFYLASKY